MEVSQTDDQFLNADISMALGRQRQEALKPFLTVTEGQSTKSRLHFAIRPEVNRFLESLAFGEHGQPLPDEEATKRMRRSN